MLKVTDKHYSITDNSRYSYSYSIAVTILMITLIADIICIEVSYNSNYAKMSVKVITIRFIMMTMA